MRYNELLVYEPGNQYPDAGQVAPFASLPAWWRRFIFQVLNGREFAVYMHIAMMVDRDNAIAYALVDSIQRDMGLRSDSQVFGALANLEKLGFIRRRRMKLPNRSSRVPRNVYQRSAPEFTLLELLKRARLEDGGEAGDIGIDEFLNPVRCPAPSPSDPNAYSAVPKDVQGGLKRLLDQSYDEYAYSTDGDKREVLMRLLGERLDERRRKGGEKYSNPEPAPRDRQREAASKREKAIAASGGVSASAGPVDFDFSRSPVAEFFEAAFDEEEIPF